MQQLEFQGLGPDAHQLTDEDWMHKSWELSDLFSPSAPVQETELFAGRVSQMHRLIETIYQRGQSAVVYGYRGVGKTSLISTFQKRVFPASSAVTFFNARCLAGNDFYDIWLRAAGKYVFEDGEVLADYIDDAITPYTILDLSKRFKASQRPVFIFDEFDRIDDPEVKLRMAETIKLISDEAPYVTIVVVGIAHTIKDLLSEHESVKRAARQIEMPLMSRAEIIELVSVRLRKAGMQIGDNACDSLATLSRGMPGYAHLLGMYSAKEAIGRKSLDVETQDIIRSLSSVLEEAGESTSQEYEEAVNSTKLNSQYREVLLACALAKQNEFGAFTAASVREPVSRLLGEPREIPSFARHLTAFCEDERGPILERSGTPKSYKYRFVEPHMQTFVIIKGIRDRMIPVDDPAVEANLLVR